MFVWRIKMKIERTLLAKRLKQPQETIDEQVRGIFEKRMKEWRPDVSSSNPVYGQHEVYIKTGEALLDHNGITGARTDDSVVYFNCLREDFFELGRDVAHLVDHYKDDGLLQEEPCWLGSWIVTGTPSELHQKFELVDSLKESPIMRLISQSEVQILIRAYEDGKKRGVREDTKYGAGLETRDADGPGSYGI